MLYIRFQNNIRMKHCFLSILIILLGLTYCINGESAVSNSTTASPAAAGVVNVNDIAESADFSSPGDHNNAPLSSNSEVELINPVNLDQVPEKSNIKIQNAELKTLDYVGDDPNVDGSGGGPVSDPKFPENEVIDAIEEYAVNNIEYYSELSLRKCHCNGKKEVWTGSSCVEHTEDTIVAVVDDLSLHPVAARPSWYGNIQAGPVNCKNGYVKTTVKGGAFNLFMGTELLAADYIFHEGEFCIEHIYDAAGGLSWEAEACLPPPTVPTCCLDGETFSSDTKQCNENSTADIQEFLPPIFASGSALTLVDTTLNNTLECPKDEEKRWMKIGENSTTLLYEMAGVILSWRGGEPSPIITQPYDYCLAVENQGGDLSYWASVCYKDAWKEHQTVCQNATCVRKCCHKGQIYDTQSFRCVDLPEDDQLKLWQPKFHGIDADGKEVMVDRPDDYTPIYGFPLRCQYFIVDPIAEPELKFYLFQNGSLHVPTWNEKSPVPSTSYCVDNFRTEDSKSHERAIVCFPEKVEEASLCTKISKYLHMSLVLVSCVFLVITILVYAIVPELHAKVHGKSLLSHVSSLLVAYTSLVVVRWWSSALPMSWCIAMASIIHISFLASFFWLNVMCFDIYWTLRLGRSGTESASPDR